MSSSPENKYTITPMWLLTHNTQWTPLKRSSQLGALVTLISALFHTLNVFYNFLCALGSRIADYLNDLYT